MNKKQKTHDKIKVKTPLVEIDGDEMTRVMWQWVKDKLLLPYLDMPLEYYDLGLKHRDETNDQVTFDAAEAIKKHGVGVKCATITPNKDRIKEYNLKKEWPSPNGTIRAALDGTVFRAPILVKNIPPSVQAWKKPIHIGSHAYGDVYKNQEYPRPRSRQSRARVHQRRGQGTVRADHPRIQRTRRHPRHPQHRQIHPKLRQSLLHLRLRPETPPLVRHQRHHQQDLRRAIPQDLPGRIREELEQKYEEAGIEYFFTLIDDAVARIMKSEGGMLWACKNYDGDVMSDMLGSAYGSLAMMTSRARQPAGLLRVRSGTRHRPETLLQVPERRKNLQQPHGPHLRLDRLPQETRRTGQHPRRRRLRKETRKSSAWRPSKAAS